MSNPQFNSPAPDPFDVDALRAAPLHDVDLERELTTVPVRKPGRQEFFRVHPDPQYVVDSYVLERVTGQDRETYWVTPGLRSELLDELRPVRLFTAITKHGTVFLWPAKLPRSGGGNGAGQAWHRSALLAAEEAKRLWVKPIANKALGAYEFVKARGDLGEPQWPDKSYRELLEIAFRDRLIATLEHPVIRELNGRAVILGLPYDEIWALDFEFVAEPGERPVPVCLVARELGSGRELRLWRDELPARPPFRTDDRVLFVAYFAPAELGCFLALDWPLPARVLDLYAEFRAETNGLPLGVGRSLLGALAHHRVPGITSEEKAEGRALVLRGGPWSQSERRAILDYCATDVAEESSIVVGSVS